MRNLLHGALLHGEKINDVYYNTIKNSYGRKYSITMHLPPLSVVVFKYDYNDPNGNVEIEQPEKKSEKKSSWKLKV